MLSTNPGHGQARRATASEDVVGHGAAYERRAAGVSADIRTGKPIDVDRAARPATTAEAPMATPAVLPDVQPLSEADWRLILRRIRAERCVPFLASGSVGRHALIAGLADSRHHCQSALGRVRLPRGRQGRPAEGCPVLQHGVRRARGQGGHPPADQRARRQAGPVARDDREPALSHGAHHQLRSLDGAGVRRCGQGPCRERVTNVGPSRRTCAGRLRHSPWSTSSTGRSIRPTR